MPPVALRGFLPETRNQFLPIRVKHRKGWTTKFQCIYPNCAKRKLACANGSAPQRLETTYSQIYIHSMRFHRSASSEEDDDYKHERKVIDNFDATNCSSDKIRTSTPVVSEDENEKDNSPGDKAENEKSKELEQNETESQ